LRAVLKEKKETFIGFTSLTFIVFLATLTCVFYENSPQFFYLAARDSLGDADIMVLPKLESYSIPYSETGSANSTVQSAAEVQAKGFEDFSDTNPYQFDPFTYAEKRAGQSATKEDGGEEKPSQEPVSIQLPLVNVTELELLLESTWQVDGQEERVKDTLGVAGIFPRWAGFGNLSHDADGSRSLNALFNLGDSKKETEMGVAGGFPNVSMSKDDIIIPEAFAEFFGISDSVKRGEVPGVNLTFDLLSMAL
jgi:hypothetical protein